MTLVRVENLQKSYGSSVVLANASFCVDRNQKVALVGHNGVGKTTLLRIVAGLEVADIGLVDLPSDIRVGYLPQDTSLTGSRTIIQYLADVTGLAQLEAQLDQLSANLHEPSIQAQYEVVHQSFERLSGYTFQHRVDLMLAGFGLQYISATRRLDALSSGQKSKVALIGILLQDADLLLLDEPTNNLDLPALIWLEEYLRNSESGCIVISHDRRFLDRVTKKVMEIDWSTRELIVRNGTYSDFLRMRQKERQRLKEQYRLQREEIERIESRARQKKASAIRGANWVSTDNDKYVRGFKRDRAARSSRTANALEKRLEHMEMVQRPVERGPLSLEIAVSDSPGHREIEFKEVVAGYPETNFRIGPISMRAIAGSRIGILGLNGAGKSTFLKALTKDLEPLSGTVNHGPGLKIENMMQEHETLPRHVSPFELMQSRTELDRSQIYAKLAKFHIDEKQVLRPISVLSPGNRARLLLALFSALSVNALVLDEPTNHMDLEALEALEDAITSYIGTIVLVSHDRYFIDHARLDTLYELNCGKLMKIANYENYLFSIQSKAQEMMRLL